jgi:pimeloyl-ACP methyl ester carboxylesterase
MLLTWLMLLGFELVRAHSQMLGKRRMSMKNEKELMLLVTGTSTRGAHEKEKSYMTVLVGIFLVVILLFASKERLMSQTNQQQKVRNVVLVHGGLVDGSGWEGVYNALKKSGYAVTVVQEATATFADDVATTKRAIAQQNGPVILVGHSYGGAVITEAGNDPKVAGLVYISAFAPDKGESVSTLIKNPPPGAPVLPILPPVDGYLLFDKAKFPAFFAGDLSPEKAAFMADSQVPWGVNALNGTISEPAWKAKPSWYLLTTEDKMIPPDAQRQMAKRAGAVIVEVKGSHSTYVSHPQAVATLIEEAAKDALLVPAR